MIDAQHRATLDLDNELTQKTAFAASVFRGLNLGFGLEQPFPWKGGVKMFDLQPFQELVAFGAETVIFDQCEYEAETVKPTEILFWGIRFGPLQARCSHGFGTHSTAVGRHEGKFKTAGLAAYPPALSKALADAIAESLHVEVDSSTSLGFVEKGLGTPVGLSVGEQVSMALDLLHDRVMDAPTMDVDNRRAIQYEIASSPEEIDSYRKQILDELEMVALSSIEANVAWHAEVPLELQRLLSPLHLPLWSYVHLQLTETEEGYTDDTVVTDISCGFPFLGILPRSGASATPILQQDPVVAMEGLIAYRDDLNALVARKARKSQPFAADLMDIAEVEVGFGAMSPPQVFTPSHGDSVSYCRRIPVREERSSGWRTRAVDHESENLTNSATSPTEAIVNDTVDDLLAVLLMFLEAGIQPKMWKRDFSKAFRRLGIRAEHLQFAWVLWMIGDLYYRSQHIAQPMGCIAAVHAWHRVGALVTTYVRRILHAPTLRYVDDLFGGSREGVYWTAGRCLDKITALLGLPLDPGKSENDMVSMTVLGARVVASLSEEQVALCISEDKAAKSGFQFWTPV